MKNLLVVSALAVSVAGSALAQTNPLADYQVYRKAVTATANLWKDQGVRNLVKEHGLNITSITWEDTGRFKNSSWGPNISDMSIQAHVVGEGDKIEPVLMPVIRYENFSDKTADLSPNSFSLLVGNEKGAELKRVSLTEYLDNLGSYLSDNTGWTGIENSLLSPRDSKVLVSAQVSMLPIPEGQKATFNPVLFNYQSSEKNPAVLAILATREGTSATIIDNTRDGFEEGRVWGQRLFFNENGMRASLTGERKAEFIAREGDDQDAIQANGKSGLNMVLLIQVPLVHKTVPRRWFGYEALSMTRSAKVDDAVIGHGPIEGPFTELDGLNIKRDHRFPVRVTVQFYKATEGAKLTEQDVAEMRKTIDGVYANADAVGSLVTEGKTGRDTEHDGPKCSPIWWGPFWPYYRNLTGLETEAALEKLDNKYGIAWYRFCREQDIFELALEEATGIKTLVEEDEDKSDLESVEELLQ
jgi:hypothetical protein